MLQSAQFTQPPPPVIPNLSVPPPMPPHHFSQHRFHGDRGGHRGHHFQPFRPYLRPGPGGPDSEFDGKRLRKSVMRKTVDYNSAIIKMLECRVWQRDFRDRRALQPDVLYYPDLQPPPAYVDNPINSVTTRFVKTATNKMRCPIFCMAWTPEGRRLVTGASSGEFTLWNGLTFNFETILQAHDSPVRTMVWSHNDVWMVTGDHFGYVKYWQSNMNNVKMFQAHKEAIRGLSFSPTDHKFVTCSDDGSLRIWDFMRCHEERILRGHGADVKCCHWHPQKGLIISGSKDNQQPVKLWDPKTGQSLATLHAHKSTVMDIKWNANGNWLVTASRDHLLKLFDLRNLSQEVQTFRGHKKEASSVAWHPYHEGLFCSGGSDGAILFWHVGADKEVGGIEQAHESIVWTLAWHPLGHILCSGSNDHTSKFWTRNRPGDLMRDKYNLNTLPAGLPGVDDQDIDEPAVIPGMGPEDKVETVANQATAQIPGLDFEGVEDRHKPFHKKVPYSKPIPRNFQAQWNETGLANAEDVCEDDSDEENSRRSRRQLIPKNPISEVITQLIETNPPPGVVPLSQLQPQAIILFGKLVPVEGNPALAQAIAEGPEALQRLIQAGKIEELRDVMPFVDDEEVDYNEDDMDVETTTSDIELPAPLPSSAFAKKNTGDSSSNSGTTPSERPRKSRFSDISEPPARTEPNNVDGPKLRGITPLIKTTSDEDMRLLPMKAPREDMRSLPVKAPHSAPDQDLRFGLPGDVDLRQPPRAGPPLAGDQDFRRFPGDNDMRQLGNDNGRYSVDEDLRLGSGDQDLRSVPVSMPPGLLGTMPYEADSDLRQQSGIPPLLPRPILSPVGGNRDVDGRLPHFGPGGQRGPMPLTERDAWTGPRKRRWANPDDKDEELPGQGNPGHMGQAGAFVPGRSSSGRSFGPPGREFGSGRGSPGGNFGPGRGLSPSGNFGPERDNFREVRGGGPDNIRDGGPDNIFRDPRGPDNFPPEEMENMRVNFERGFSRGGSYGPDGDRGDGYLSDEMDDDDEVDPFAPGNGQDWGGSGPSHSRGPYQGQYPYHMEPSYPSRGAGGRGFSRGRSNYDRSRSSMRGGPRGRFSGGRGRGGRGAPKRGKDRGNF